MTDYIIYTRGSKLYVTGKDEDFLYSGLIKNINIKQISKDSDDFLIREGMAGWYPTQKLTIGNLYKENGTDLYTKSEFLELSEQLGKGSSGTGGASIADDMYFASTNERDTFTTDNPDRIFQGVTCAVTNGSNLDYYQYNVSTWEKANLIFQGEKGEKGDAGGGLVKVGYIDDPNTAEVEFLKFDKDQFHLTLDGSGQDGKLKIESIADGRKTVDISQDDYSSTNVYIINSEKQNEFNYFNILTTDNFNRFVLVVDTVDEDSKDFVLNVSEYSNAQPKLNFNGDEITLIFGMSIHFVPNKQTSEWEFYIQRLPYYVYNDDRYLDGKSAVWDSEEGFRTAAVNRGELANWHPDIDGKNGMVMSTVSGVFSGQPIDSIGRTIIHHILLDDGTSRHFLRTSNDSTVKDKPLIEIYTDPAKGFTLDLNAVIKGKLNTNEVVELLHLNDVNNFIIGNTKSSPVIEAKDGKAYVSDGNQLKKILLEGEIPDNFTTVKLDVKNNTVFSIDNTYVSKEILLISTIENFGIAVLNFDEFNNFAEGDTIRIVLDGSYTKLQDRAVVNLKNQDGSFKQIYTTSTITVRAENGYWNEIVPKDRLLTLLNGGNTTFGINPNVKGVDGINFNGSEKAVKYEDLDDGVRVLTVDLTHGENTITSDDPLEVKVTNKGTHDAIGVTDAGKLTFGTPSSEIIETEIATAQQRISVNHVDENGDRKFSQLAYLSDITSLESSAIQWQNVMDAEPIATGTYVLKAVDKITGQEVNAGVDDLLTLDYESSSSYPYTIQLGVVKERKEKTGQDWDIYESVVSWDSGNERFVLEVTESSNQKAFHFSINASTKIELSQQVINKGDRGKESIYWRGDSYTITEEQIQKDIIFQAEPFVKDAQGVYSCTIMFPSLDIMTKYYYIPLVNEDKKDLLPHIGNLNIKLWLDPEEGHLDTEHRLYLKSVDNSFSWGTTTKIGDEEGCFIYRPKNDTSRNILADFYFMKHEPSGTTDGKMKGYTLQCSEEDNVYSLTTTPTPQLNVNEALNIKLLQNNEGHVYAGFNRETPVVASEQLDNLQLIKIIEQDDTETLPVIAKCVVGELASGFSLCEDNTPADTEILQIASGKYLLSVEGLTDNDKIGEYVYIDADGKLTLDKSEFVVGWVIKDGVIIDVDIYNAHINSSSIDAFDVLTTRVLNIHEGSDNPDKLSEYSVDGNFNHNEKLVGSPHIYVKDKDTGDLTQSYQILTDGSVDFKKKILSPVLELLNTNESALKNTILRVDGSNQNTVLQSVGAFYLKQFNKNTGEETLSLLVDTSGRFVFKNAISTSRIQNEGGWSSNSNVNEAGFVDFSTLGSITIGAKDKISLAVSGKKINITPDFIDFSDTGLGNLRNVGLVSRNDSHDKNSIALNNAEIVYKTDLHTFRSGDNVEYINFSSVGVNLKNNNIKHIRHLVGNGVGSMFVANVSLIKRNDDENDKNSIVLFDGTIQNHTNNFQVTNHLSEDILTVDSAQLNVHGNQVKELAEGTEDTDAVNYGQIKGFDNIPYLRKFDSTGGDIYAHNYPEGRVQSWINYKGNGVDDLRIDSMRNGSAQKYDQIVVDNQSVNICKLRLFYNGNSTLLRVLPGEIVQCYASRDFTRWKWVYGTESSPSENSSFLIEENNDEIITPNKGDKFVFQDSDKDSGYGDEGYITYLSATLNDSQNQQMLNNLNISKSWFIHKSINTTKGFLMLHESYVSQIYNKDVTGINTLSMLFGTDNRGRLGKSGQNLPEGYKLNWNGEYIPNVPSENVQALNPTHWIDKDGNITETWSNNVKSPCYSIGTLSNDGSAALQRGNVIHENTDGVLTSRFELDNTSEFFVLPASVGGGTFSQIKVFPFFQSRKSQVIEEDAYTFERSSDAIGTLLSISYDAAVQQQNLEQSINDYMLNLGLSTGNLYVGELRVL